MKEEIQNETAQTLSQREGRMFSFLFPVLEVIKVVMASVASVVFLGFGGVTLACSAVALAVSTPLFIIFSPILVPATIATTLLATGLGAGTTLGVTGMGLLMRLIKHPGKEGAASAPAAQPSFLSLLEMPNFIKSKMLERLIHIPGVGKKSEGRGESKGKKGKSEHGRGKHEGEGKSKGRKGKSRGKDKDKKKGKGSRKGSSDDDESS
ncbi:hypothetical protein BRARA_C00301 [Brassica rapa]|uniref:Oleosin n=2 Tax=Brassica TaxID=3705 RepID=A0A397ZSY8_BRACM|nr:hypothetical protein BRARA_C00301 [Brassica rapa]CAF2118852.1 unnamed protein product [Brassica napus]CAG7878987.1 unnamed protein product [Brassica rapa]